MQSFRAGGEERSTEVPAGVADEEGEFGGRAVCGGDYEVAFVFSRGGVEDYDWVTAGW